MILGLYAIRVEEASLDCFYIAKNADTAEETFRNDYSIKGEDALLATLLGEFEIQDAIMGGLAERVQSQMPGLVKFCAARGLSHIKLRLPPVGKI